MSDQRVYNFSAGPSMLPLSALERAGSEITNYRGSGMSVMEMSHRSKVLIQIFEDTQEKVFNTWFELIKGQLSGDVAGNLQNAIDETKERLRLIEGMCLTNDFIAPLATDDETLTVITDDLGNAILADWKYKEE